MNPATTNSTQFAQIAQARAKTYSTLATVFSQKPDRTLVSNLITTGPAFFAELVREMGSNRDAQKGVSEISQFVAEVKNSPIEDTELALQVDWTRLFRGVQPGYGPIPPYEGLYMNQGENDLETMQAVAAFYSAYGVLPNEAAGNRPDYIGLELDFLRCTCEEQVEAWEKGDHELSDKWYSAEQNFVLMHLGRWGAAYCDRAIEEARTDFYRGFASLTKGLLQELAENPRPLTVGTM